MGEVASTGLALRAPQWRHDSGSGAIAPGRLIARFKLDGPPHQWLFLNTLDSLTALRRHVSFYVAAHNTQIPHSAFLG